MHHNATWARTAAITSSARGVGRWRRASHQFPQPDPVPARPDRIWEKTVGPEIMSGPETPETRLSKPNRGQHVSLFFLINQLLADFRRPLNWTAVTWTLLGRSLSTRSLNKSYASTDQCTRCHPLDYNRNTINRECTPFICVSDDKPDRISYSGCWNMHYAVEATQKPAMVSPT
jgi:hypothetical protein